MIRKIKTAGTTTVFVVTFVVALTQIWDWLTAPSQELVAIVSYGSFKLPPGLNHVFQDIRNSLDPEQLRKNPDVEEILKTASDESCDRLADRILDRISRVVRMNMPYGTPYSEIEGYWAVSIRNDGSQTLSSVTLSLPFTRYVYIEREGESATFSESSGRIVLESLQPQESANVIAWTSIEPSSYILDTVKLTHSAGIGKLNLQAPVGKLGQFVDSYWALLLFLATVTFLLAFLQPIRTAPEYSSERAFQEHEFRRTSRCSRHVPCG